VSLLPKLDREIAQEELLASAPIVARELESHFNISGTVFAERWVESQYTVPAGQTLRLHGQMDAIITTPEKTLVFDYKTKQYMSENAIRGLTEGSDGKYFRQLVFYKILLSGNHAYNTHDIVPALVFIKPDDKGRCQTVTLPVTEEDVLQVKSDINTLVESVESGRFITESCDDVSCEYCNLKKLLQ
jgi:hypothetical protein